MDRGVRHAAGNHLTIVYSVIMVSNISENLAISNALNL